MVTRRAIRAGAAPRCGRPPGHPAGGRRAGLLAARAAEPRSPAGGGFRPAKSCRAVPYPARCAPYRRSRLSAASTTPAFFSRSAPRELTTTIRRSCSGSACW